MRVAAVESTTLVTVSYDDARECCNSSSVAGRFTNISISPRRCISRCWMLHPRGAISIRPFGFPCRLISISLPLRSVGKYLPGAIVEEIQMARTLAELPAGSRITDYISLGVIAKFFPAEKIHEVLQQTNRASVRERDLPAHVVVYYVIALALYMRSSYREVLGCLLEGVQWLLNPSQK